MSVILLLIPLSVILASAFLAAFIWAVRSGQYEDTCTPSMRMLVPDPAHRPKTGRQHAEPSTTAEHPDHNQP